jgi:hypothetical protein
MVMDIYKCVKETDKKEWKNLLLAMFKKYV